MPDIYHADETFEGIDFTDEKFEIGDYEFCRFVNCNFSNIKLSECTFIECEFDGCDLSMAKVYDVSLRDTNFVECKMVGLQFDTCNDFGFSPTFEACNLNLSSFFRVKLNHGVFKNCSLQEIDFSQAILKEAVFHECDFLKATFSSTQLQKADFRSSFNYSIHPEQNQLEGARFNLDGLSGLLDSYGIEVE